MKHVGGILKRAFGAIELICYGGGFDLMAHLQDDCFECEEQILHRFFRFFPHHSLHRAYRIGQVGFGAPGWNGSF